MKTDHNEPEAKIFFWIKHILLVLLSCFFLLFGIHILIAAYTLNDPFSFILTFFASNFMILISATLIFVFIYRMKVFCVRSKLNGPTAQKKHSPPEQGQDEER
jgi:hypothetical protein